MKKKYFGLVIALLAIVSQQAIAIKLPEIQSPFRTQSITKENLYRGIKRDDLEKAQLQLTRAAAKLAVDAVNNAQRSPFYDELDKHTKIVLAMVGVNKTKYDKNYPNRKATRAKLQGYIERLKEMVGK